MFVVHVQVHVKKDRVEDFISATRENAQNSLQEKGVKRFDVFQEDEDPTVFLLEEIYLTPADSASHKDTQHYRKWKNLVESMMSEPRHSLRFRNIFPDNQEWK